MFVNVDKEILHGSSIILEYKFTAENNSETDMISKNLDAIRNKDILENTYKLLDSLGTAKYTKDFDYLKDYKKSQIKKDVKNMLKAAAKKAKEAKKAN